MRKVVIDTDIFINHIRGKSPYFKNLMKFAKEQNIKLYIPNVVFIEIFIGYEFNDKKVLAAAKRLLSEFERVPLTDKIANLASKIGRKHKLGFMGSVDLAVAATALNLKAEVATENTKHFKLVPKLKLFTF